MKKIGILIGGTFLLAACDASPGGNKDILPVVHDQSVEHTEHQPEDPHGHTTEQKDSTHEEGENHEPHVSADSVNVQNDAPATNHEAEEGQ